jgi:hypothetical protein
MTTRNINHDKDAGRNSMGYWTLGGQQKPKELQAQNINLAEIHATDNPNNGSKKRRTILLAILAVVVVATAVILGVFLSSGGSKDGNGSLTDVPTLAPSSDSNPTLLPMPGSTLSTDVPSLTPSSDSNPTLPESSLSPSSAALYSCMMPGTEVAVAYASLGATVLNEAAECTTSPCVVDVKDADEYGLLRDTCNATGGAFHVFTYNLTCSGNSYIYYNLPMCSSCTADSTKADFESSVDYENCTDVFSHTGTTDFSGSATEDPPASSPSDSSPPCLVMSSAVQTARGNLDDQVGSDVLDCSAFKSDCVFDVSTKHGYAELMEACEAAKGVFHVIKLEIKCRNLSLEFNNYPECLVSENQDSACTTAFLEESFETAWDVDGCNETATSLE